MLALWLSGATAQKLPPGVIIGSDGPADEETQGFYIYHAGLNVCNLTASMELYGKVLGMRHMFTLQYTPNFSMAYMGFSQGRRNGTGYQTGPELLRDKNNRGGMVKLFYFDKSEEILAASTERTYTFANLGLVVPDIQVAQDRMDKKGVKTIKRLGAKTAAFYSALANATNVGPQSTDSPAEVDALIKGQLTTDVERIIFVLNSDLNDWLQF